MGRGVIMLFELKSVFLNEGLEQQLSYELDISEIDMDGVFPFTSPVAVTAIARNRAGLVTLTLHCGYDYTRSCDRCGEPFTRRENKTSAAKEPLQRGLQGALSHLRRQSQHGQLCVQRQDR